MKESAVKLTLSKKAQQATQPWIIKKEKVKKQENQYKKKFIHILKKKH